LLQTGIFKYLKQVRFLFKIILTANEGKTLQDQYQLIYEADDAANSYCIYINYLPKKVKRLKARRIFILMKFAR